MLCNGEVSESLNYPASPRFVLPSSSWCPTLMTAVGHGWRIQEGTLAIASLAVLLFDFIITFDSEVHWTWGRGWGIMRIIFILSRYVPFVGLAMTVYCSVASTHGGIPHHDIFIALYDGCITIISLEIRFSFMF